MALQRGFNAAIGKRRVWEIRKFGNVDSGIDHWLLADPDEGLPDDLSISWIKNATVRINTPIMQIRTRKL